MRRARTLVRGASAAAAILAAFPAFYRPFLAWPEMIVPAYFITKGSVLYREIFFPYTPLFLLATALAGRLVGFSALLFRSLLAVALGVTGVLVVAALRPHGRFAARSVALALLAGVPTLVLATDYLSGFQFYPEPFMAALAVGALLALERAERSGRMGPLWVGAFLLGIAILLKQTSAWLGISAILWQLVVRCEGRALRERVRRAAIAATGVSAPYLSFTVIWGVCYRTVEHVDWTFLMLVFGGVFQDELEPFSATSFLSEATILALPILALLVLGSDLSGRGRLRSPLLALSLGCLGMAWPRGGIFHLATSAGLLAVTTVRAARVWSTLVTRRRSPGRLAVGTALLLTFGITLFLGAVRPGDPYALRTLVGATLGTTGALLLVAVGRRAAAVAIVLAIGWTAGFSTPELARFLPLAPIGLGGALLIERAASRARWACALALGGLLAIVTLLAGPTPGGVDATEIAVLALAPAACLIVRKEEARSPVPWLALLGLAGAFATRRAAPLIAVSGLAWLLWARSVGWALELGRRRARRVTSVVGAALLAPAVLLVVVHVTMLYELPARGPTWFWDDPVTRQALDQVLTRVGPGGRFFIFNAPWDTLYPLSGGLTPDGTYLNPTFTTYMARKGIDEHMVDMLRRAPGTLVLYRAPNSRQTRLRETKLARFLDSATTPVAGVSGGSAWRRVPYTAGTEGDRDRHAR